MSKFDELETKRQTILDTHAELVEKSDAELDVVDAELDVVDAELEKLEADFVRKVKGNFRGVKVSVKVDEKGLMVYIGDNINGMSFIQSGVCALQYSKDYYNCDTDVITSELGVKLRDLHIEYFGEL